MILCKTSSGIIHLLSDDRLPVKWGPVPDQASPTCSLTQVGRFCPHAAQQMCYASADLPPSTPKTQPEQQPRGAAKRIPSFCQPSDFHPNAMDAHQAD